MNRAGGGAALTALWYVRAGNGLNRHVALRCRWHTVLALVGAIAALDETQATLSRESQPTQPPPANRR